MTSSKSGASATAQPPASGTTKKSAMALATAQKREAQRKQLAEMRRKNKLAMSAAVDENVTIDQTLKVSTNQSNNEENSAENETDR